MISISVQPSLFGGYITLHMYDNGLGVHTTEVNKITKEKLLREKLSMLDAYCKTQVDSIIKQVEALALSPSSALVNLKAQLDQLALVSYIKQITKGNLLSQMGDLLPTQSTMKARKARTNYRKIGKITRYYEQLLEEAGQEDVEDSGGGSNEAATTGTRAEVA